MEKWAQSMNKKKETVAKSSTITPSSTINPNKSTTEVKQTLETFKSELEIKTQSTNNLSNESFNKVSFLIKIF